MCLERESPGEETYEIETFVEQMAKRNQQRSKYTAIQLENLDVVFGSQERSKFQSKKERSSQMTPLRNPSTKDMLFHSKLSNVF